MTGQRTFLMVNLTGFMRKSSRLADGWRWSPDGKKIAFWRFDQTRVKEFYMIDEMFVYNKVTPLKYPKTGEENSIIKIGVFNLASGETKWMDIGEETDIYIPRIYWTNSSDKLAILRLNRLTKLS